MLWIATVIVTTELIRGLLAPVGHGLWTAVLGAVLFAAASGSRLRVTGGVIGWYVAVSLLHGFWDLSGGLAALITWWITAQVWQVALIERGRMPAPTQTQQHVFTALYWGLLLLNALVGLLCLRRVLARAAR